MAIISLLITIGMFAVLDQEAFGTFGSELCVSAVNSNFLKLP